MILLIATERSILRLVVSDILPKYTIFFKQHVWLTILYKYLAGGLLPYKESRNYIYL